MSRDDLNQLPVSPTVILKECCRELMSSAIYRHARNYGALYEARDGCTSLFRRNYERFVSMPRRAKDGSLRLFHSE